jgi:hypothetical protein
VDVIYVHRLLKNPVEVPEYLLVTDELYAAGGAASAALAMHEIELELEGIGRVQTHFVDVDDIAPLPPLPDPSWPQRIGGTFAMIGRGLPHIIRRRRPQSALA